MADRYEGSLDADMRTQVIEQYLRMLMTDIPAQLCELVRSLRSSIVCMQEMVAQTAQHAERVTNDLQRVLEQLEYTKTLMYRLCDEANKAQLIGPVLRALHGDTDSCSTETVPQADTEPRAARQDAQNE